MRTMVARVPRRVLLHAMRAIWPDSGQDLVEYALLLLLIALVVIGVVATVGTDAQGLYNRIGTQIVALL